MAIERWATPDQQVLIDVATPGTWFGELAVLLHTQAAGTRTGMEAVARTDARVLVLRLAAYDELIEGCPDTTAGSRGWRSSATTCACARKPSRAC